MKPNKPKRKISQRELWLIALLPAALVVILSLAVPGPAGVAAEMEERLDRLTSGNSGASMHTQLRDLAAEHQASRQQMAELEAREAVARAGIESLQAPAARRALAFNMAEGLDELTSRLGGHGVQVLAMVEDAGSGQGKFVAGTKGRAASGGSTIARRDWQVSVAATWPAMREALADAGTFPRGLALSALKMEPPRPNVRVQRWELMVSDSGATP